MNSPRLIRALPWAAALITMTLWASSFVVIRGTADHFSPGPMSLLRMATAAVVLTGWVLLNRPRFHRSARTWLIIAAWGVAWFGVYNVALNAAGHHIDAATASMVVNLAPLIVAVAAVALLGEKLRPRLLIGIVVALGGIALITLATFTGHITVLGLLLSLLSAVIYAGCVLTQKRWLSANDSNAVTFAGVMFGTLACAPFAGQLIEEVAVAPLSATASILYLGIFPTAIAFSLWGFSLQRTPAGLLSTSSLIVPAIVVVLAWLILGETPPPLAAFGGALCLAGASFAIIGQLVQARPRQGVDAPEPHVLEATEARRV